MAKPVTKQTASVSAARLVKTTAVPPRVKVSAATKQTIAFGIRLKAWWEGYDAAALQTYLTTKFDTANTSAVLEESLVPAREIASLPDSWDKGRIEIAQLIWGKEYCGPGGPDHIIAISKLLTLNPEMSMVDLAAGLGGAARVLAEHFGVWVSGYETSQALVDSGNALSLMAGKTKKAAMARLDIHAAQPFDRRFDRALANGFLSRLEDKPAMLKKIDQALKPEGMLLINDFFARDEHVLSHPDMAQWLSKETSPLYFSTLNHMTEALEALGLHIRVNEQTSGEYVKLVTDAWRNAEGLVANLMADDTSAVKTKLLMREAELWAKRLELIKSKQIEVRRILAVKTIARA